MPPIERIATDADGKIRLSAAFRFCLDTQARIACLEPLPNQNPALVNALLDRIPHWRFRAAARDGQPAAAESTLWVHVEGSPDTSGRFSMKVSYVGTGPRSLKRPSPMYPRSELRRRRSGNVMLRAEVLADGRVGQVSAVEQWSDSRFINASIKAIQQWTFEPERIDGRPISTWVQIPVRFHARGEAPTPPPWLNATAHSDDLPLAENSPIEWLDSGEG